MTQGDRKPDKTHAGSVDGDLLAFANAALGPLKWPRTVTLRPGDRAIWYSIMEVRARDEWSTVDLLHAANLTRCMADIERLSAELAVSGGDIVKRGEADVINPRHELIEKLSRRALVLTKLLHLHASVLRGDPRDAAAGRAAEQAARAAQQANNGEPDDLLATPTQH